MKKILALALALIMALSLAACGGGGTANTGDTNATDTNTGDTGSGEGKGLSCTISLITMDQMDVHWVKLHAAAEATVEEYKVQGYDVTLNWLAPEKKDNAQQIQMIETATNNGSDVIIIAVNDSTACNDAIQAAIDAGIKIIYVDSPSTIEGSATYATNNYAAGAQAGEQMLTYLDEKGLTEGTIGIVSAQAGVQSCIDRVDGFISAFEGTGFTMGEVQYSDGDASKAQEITNALIQDGVIAVYGANDGATNGAGNAVKEANANGADIICVGFDNSASNRALVNDGALLAFMAQNPDVMGSEAIKAAISLMEGEDLGGVVVDTGVTTVTSDNVADFED
ncbi:substrate-binding domain-containing protein [Candidatus Avoscillospira sp. LCP25S3_F1]|uniref:substrate-binding domain-containing protein n=1 Tax=Candidatus Avoscillospira sp. LCP25S3_F1 TaxID=3438825 RepID=UPI003F93D7AF